MDNRENLSPLLTAGKLTGRHITEAQLSFVLTHVLHHCKNGPSGRLQVTVITKGGLGSHYVVLNAK